MDNNQPKVVTLFIKTVNGQNNAPYSTLKLLNQPDQGLKGAQQISSVPLIQARLPGQPILLPKIQKPPLQLSLQQALPRSIQFIQQPVQVLAGNQLLADQQPIEQQLHSVNYIGQDDSTEELQTFNPDSLGILQFNTNQDLTPTSYICAEQGSYSDVLQASSDPYQYSRDCDAGELVESHLNSSQAELHDQPDGLQVQSDGLHEQESEQDGCQYTSDPQESENDFMKLLNTSTERIKHCLDKITENINTKERLKLLLRNAETYEIDLKLQLKAEIEKGQELRNDLKTLFSGDCSLEGIESVEVESFLKEMERGEAVAESSENCIFVECIKADNIPADVADGLTSHIATDSVSSESFSQQSAETNEKRRRTAKKHFDDIVYDSKTYNTGKRKLVSSVQPVISSGIGEEYESRTSEQENGDNTDVNAGSYMLVNSETGLLESIKDPQEKGVKKTSGNLSEKLTRAPRIYQCSMCSRVFNRLADRVEHENKEHNPNDAKVAKKPWRRRRDCSYPCKKCGKSFVWFKDMLKHVRDEHYAKDPNECEMCGKRFVNRFALKNHRYSVHRHNRPFACNLCPKNYKTKNELQAHYRIHTGDKPFKCTECDESFSNYLKRKIHMRTHTGEPPPFVCNVCHYEFHVQHSLVKHMRIHTGEKPYLCSHCGKSFTENSAYRVHMRLHSNVRPFECDQCGKSYVQSERLKTHMRTHTGEKKFACEVCGMRYMYSKGLKSHMMKHSGGEPRYSCHECGRTFVNGVSLGKHMRKHVKKEVQLEYFVVDGIY